MHTKLCNVLMFVAGAAVGSAITWKLVKTKYEQIAQEEIESIREMYDDLVEQEFQEEDEDEDEADDEDDSMTHAATSMPAKPDLKEYAAMIEENGYSDYSTKLAPKKEEIPMVVDAPFAIHPDDFGEEEDYECIGLNYYADGVLTDDFDNLIEDVDGTVGEDSLTKFGEYEKDTVFVQNDAKKCYYEILRDERNFSDVYPEEE